MELSIVTYNPRITQASFGPAVNLRDLHAALGVGKDFSNWAKERLKRYGFVEGEDYQVFANSGENPQGGRPALEYLVSLDTAKELAMVEKNDRGRAIRRYFIAVEKQARADHLYATREVVLRPDGRWGRVWAVPIYTVDGVDYWNVPLFLEVCYRKRVEIPEGSINDYAIDLMTFHPHLAGAAPLWGATTDNLLHVLRAVTGCYDARWERLADMARAALAAGADYQIA